MVFMINIIKQEIPIDEKDEKIQELESTIKDKDNTI